MNAILDYTVGTLILLLVAAAVAGPALVLDRRERAIDRQLKAAERGRVPAPRRDAHVGYGRAA